MPGTHEYQVALSFAGEQRDYVEEVARDLASKSIAVFYDGFETAQLWGKDGADTFHEVYSARTTYVVMFISKDYAAKPWTRHERRSALSRMLEKEDEYILPVRFDNTPISGLPDTTLYLNANDYSPAELSAIIAKKLGIPSFVGKASDVPPPRMTSPVGQAKFNYSSYSGRYIIGSGIAEFETMGVFPLLKSLLPVVVAFLLPTTDTLDHRRVGNGTHRHGLFQEPMEELPAMA